MTPRRDHSRHSRLAERRRDSKGNLSTPPMPMAGQLTPHLLPVTSAEYIAQVDSTGCRIRSVKKSATARDTPPAPSHTSVDANAWLRLVRGEASGCRRAVILGHLPKQDASSLGKKSSPNSASTRRPTLSNHSPYQSKPALQQTTPPLTPIEPNTGHTRNR